MMQKIPDFDGFGSRRRPSMRLRGLFLFFCMVFLLTGSVFAAGDDVSGGGAESVNGRVQLLMTVDNAAVSDLRFDLYHVADWIDEKWVLTESYSNLQVDLEGEESLAAAPAVLSAFIRRDGVVSDGYGVTDAAGRVSFEELSEGLYLLVGSEFTRGNLIYTPVPALAVVPYLSDDGVLVYDTDLTMKHETRSRPSSGGGGSSSRPGGGNSEPPTIIEDDKPPLDEIARQDYRVMKTWEDAGYESERPGSVVVQLLGDGSVLDEVTLDAGNGWQHAWSDLDASVAYDVLELDVGEDYTFRVEQNGTQFVVTNLYQEEIPPEEPPTEEIPDVPIDSAQPPASDMTITEKLPQTGQQWMPVFVFAGAGIAFCWVGLLLRKRG